MNTDKIGKVYLVGAGPGDPGLITLRAVECLKLADVVIYDFLATPTLLSYVNENAELIYVGKKSGNHTFPQEEIINLLIEKAQKGLTVVRLKGGDPFVFGRGGEECCALAEAGIPFEIVPGITAGIAAPGYAGIPVTHRSLASSVAFITGHKQTSHSGSEIQWKHLARGVDTLVFYMGVKNLSHIVSELTANGRSEDTPVAIIRWGTRPSQNTITGTLATIVELAQKNSITPPAIIVVGEVVTLSEKLAWFKKRPLYGRRIFNTRSRHQASLLTQALVNLGAEVVEFPTIQIIFENNSSDLQEKVDTIKDYDWLIFTSINSVHAFLKCVIKKYHDIRALGSVKIAGVGSGTEKAINSYHIQADIIAKNAVAEGLIAELQSADSWNNKRVLLPRAEKARDVLPDTLSDWGARVETLTVYKTVKPADINRHVLQDIQEDRYDCITFTSSSTVKNFVALLKEENLTEIIPAIKAVSIGPVTTATMIEAGMKPITEAEEHSIPGLVKSIEEYLIP